MADTDDDDRTVIRPSAPAGHEKTQVAGPPPGAADDHGNGLPVGTYLGEFELTRMIGEGGFGIVYLATDHSLQRRVALKEYMPSSLAARTGASNVQVKSERYRETFAAGLKSFINEARLLASFDHPSLVKVYRFWEANGTAYMVMPFYEGTTLKDVLRAMGSAPDETWLRQMLEPLTQALAVIHAEQCYHRDIAPDNVILLGNSHQRPLLLDFGAARRVIGDMTQALTVILKPGYAPVEQYAEVPGMKQGAWTDVYATAAMVYFAIMGRTPPPSVGRMLNDTYQPLEQAAAGRYSSSFLAAIDRALAVRPEARTQSIEQLRAELGLGGLAPAEPPVATRQIPPAPAPRAPPATATTAAATAPAGKGKAMLGIGAALLGVVAVGAYFALAPAPRPPAPPPGTVVATAPAPAPAAEPAPVAPAPPPPVAAAPAPPAGLDGAQEFDRLVQGQAAGYGIDLQATKPSYRIGKDDIGFSVQSERDGWLYVFALASDGTLAQVVPNTLSGSVKVKKGQRYRFPTGDGVVLETAEPAGPVQILAMVSDRQRDHAALEPQKMAAMRVFRTGAAAADIVAAHKGPQPLLAGRALCPANGACDDSYGAALVKVDVTK